MITDREEKLNREWDECRTNIENNLVDIETTLDKPDVTQQDYLSAITTIQVMSLRIQLENARNTTVIGEQIRNIKSILKHNA